MLFQKNVPLSQYSNFKIGGPARYFCDATSLAQLIEAIKEAQTLNESIFFIGGGNNLLISDAGFEGVVIKPTLKQLELRQDFTVHVGAGVLVSEFSDFCVAHSLSGWEWAGGLPGTMGGAIWGNAGCFGGETKDSVIRVESLNTETTQLVVRNNADCNFAYRSSIFKTQPKKEVILEVVLSLKKGDVELIKKSIEEKKEYRRVKQPLEYPNVGSIFKNTPIEKVPSEVLKQYEKKIKTDPFPVLPSAILIDAAGLREYRVGGAMVSPKHPNFIVNMGGATAADVKAVMLHVAQTVKEKFGVELEQEVIFVG
jgi:UDP-N-acetylmuramate dehydrogenase